MDFLVVGGVCAVLHGAPVTTFDLDLVHSRAADNVDRLLAALQELDARYRGPGQAGRRPNRSHLVSTGHQLLLTTYGPLDLLGVIGHDRDYESLLPHTVEIGVGRRLRIRVLDLPMLIRTKEETAQEKDRAVLPILRRTLEEKAKG